MSSLIRDLCVHQLWADGEHWRAIEAHTAAAADAAIRTRLHHIHLVQRAFSWAVGSRATGFSVTTADQFSSLAELKTYARGSHEEIDKLLSTVTDAHLDSSIVMPWFSDPPLTITVTEALTQCAMHSHYHRGQNATRLRELGGEPPMTDLIAWLWKGRPSPAWS